MHRVAGRCTTSKMHVGQAHARVCVRAAWLRATREWMHAGMESKDYLMPNTLRDILLGTMWERLERYAIRTAHLRPCRPAARNPPWPLPPPAHTAHAPTCEQAATKSTISCLASTQANMA